MVASAERDAPRTRRALGMADAGAWTGVVGATMAGRARSATRPRRRRNVRRASEVPNALLATSVRIQFPAQSLAIILLPAVVKADARAEMVPAFVCKAGQAATAIQAPYHQIPSVTMDFRVQVVLSALETFIQGCAPRLAMRQ